MKLKCKKTLPSCRENIGYLLIEGNLYELIFEDILGFTVTLECGETMFFKNIPTSKLDNHYAWDYFYTPNEFRKLKIDNLLNFK